MVHMGEERGACRVVVGKSKGKGHLNDLGIDRRIVSKRVLRK